MKVFKTCMIIIKYHTPTFLLNIILFMILAVVISSLLGEEFSTDFTAIRPSFSVINRDGDSDSEIVEGLVTFLGENGNEVELEDDRRVLQDAIFFRATDFIIIVPAGFAESLRTDSPLSLEIVKSTQIAIGFLADNLVNQYLSQVRLYLVADVGMSEETIVSAVLQDLSSEAGIEKVHFGINAPIDETFIVFTRMLNYILMVITFLCVTNITMVFRRPELRMRNLCSPLKSRSLSGQQILAGFVVAFIAWVLLTIIGFVGFGRNLGAVDIRVIALIMLNTLTLTIFSLSLATVANTFVRSANAQNAVANIMTMALCFFGGVFVPLNMLGDGVLAVSRFLPTYWNVIALETIAALTSFETSAMMPVWQAIAAQLVFATALFSISLLINKHIAQSERFNMSNRTELEA